MGTGKSQFAGSVTGNAKTSASRYGTKSTGMTAIVGGWDGMIETRVYWNHEKGCDCFRVWLVPHWQDAGKDILLAEGILNHKIEDPFVVPAVFA